MFKTDVHKRSHGIKSIKHDLDMSHLSITVQYDKIENI